MRFPAHIPPNIQERALSNSGEIKLVTAAVTLTPGENRVDVVLPASGSYNITLPPVASCPGESFVFFCRDEADGTPGTVVIIDQADGITAFANLTFAAVADMVVVQNYGGEAWGVALDNIA